MVMGGSFGFSFGDDTITICRDFVKKSHKSDDGSIKFRIFVP